MPIVDVALAIAATGLPVFPCGRNKKPAIAKKDGGHGFLDAVTDPSEVRALFAKAPHAALIGVPTGERSGFDVLDFDYRHGAADWEITNASRLPETRSHRTKSGGKHMLFATVPCVRNLASKFAPGMDVRGTGGYIIMPPSVGYSVITDVDIAEWPDWLLTILLAAKPEQAPRPQSNGKAVEISSKRLSAFAEKVAARLREAPEGGKHFALRNAALSLGGIQAAANLSDADCSQILIASLPATVRDWEAAKDTVMWGLEHGRARPITLEDRPHYQNANGNGNGNGHLAPSPPPEPHHDQPTAPPTDPRTDPRTFDGLDTNEPLQPEQKERIIRVFSGFRHVAADAALSAMSSLGVSFYQRDRSLVRASLAKAKAADGIIVEVPGIVGVSAPMLARAMGRSARWERVNKEGEVIRIDPPKEVVEQVAAMSGEWPFPPITGVIGAPTMRPDGSLLLTPGYDAVTGLVLMAPPPMPTIPITPTKRDALEALALLNSLLDEFPFTDNASRSAAMSMLLTPVLRGALAPAVPMHMVAAPQAGTGKSYLQDIASMLATGERCAVVTVAPDPQETEKRLVGAALAGYPLIALDNCNGTLTGDFLAQVTERPLLQLRPLGTSGVVRVSNVFTVFANGNNISVSADLVRRTLLCTLDANMENPETRSFSHDPVVSIAKDRGKYLAACLTLARAYVCAGMPGRLPRIASFERWSDLVRSSLVWLGWPDPSTGTETIRAEDPTRNARSAIFEAWAQCLVVGQGYQTGEIITAAETYDGVTSTFVNAELRSALFAIAKAKSAEKIDAMRLGWWLRATAKVVSGRFKLMVDRTNATHPKWSIHEI